MKTRKQKVICILASVFLLASFCVFPFTVSAAGYSTVTFSIPRYDDDTNFEFFRFARAIDTLNSAQWNSLRKPDSFWYIASVSDPVGFGYSWTWPDGYGSAGVCSFFVGISEFNTSSYNTSDTIWVDPFTFSIHLAEAYSATSHFRISLRQFDTSKGMMDGVGSCIGRSQWIQFSTSTTVDDGGASIDVPATKLYIKDPGTYDALAVCIDIQCTSMNSSIGIGFYDSKFSVNYGQGKDPSIPSFDTPPGSDEVGNLGSSEQAVLDESSSGVSEGLNKIKYTTNSIQFFGTALTIASNIVSKFLNLKFMVALINLSLGMGLLGSLLGLAGAIISAAERRASSAAHAARQAERSAFYKTQGSYYKERINYYRSRSKK